VPILLGALAGCGREGAGDQTVPAPTACAKVAAPDGDDGGRGTEEQPLATFEALANSLVSGQTGCLSEGSSGKPFAAEEFVIDDPGITITSIPGERATLRGRVYVAGTATESRLTGVDIDLAGQTSEDVGVQINAEDFEFSDSTVSDDQNQICVSVGADDLGFGSGNGTIVADNEIRNCGLPGSNFAQGIYVNGADEMLIEGNSITGVSARGVQLVGDSDANTIRRNVIWKNGQGIALGGRDGEVPDDNLIEDNVLSDPLGGYNLGFAFEDLDPQPTGNVARTNCLWAGEDPTGGIEPLSDREAPVALEDNEVTEPRVSGGTATGVCATLP
jgi:parallel beta-helix repeat protein